MAYRFNDIYQLLTSQGAAPEEARTLAAISLAESSGNPGAANVSDKERSYGLFQINLNAHNLTPQQAMDPATSAQYALKLSREQGYKPWSVFTNGMYRQFLGEGQMPTYDITDIAPDGSLPTQGSVYPSSPGSSGNRNVVYNPDGSVAGQWVLIPGADPEDPEAWQFLQARAGSSVDTDTPAQTSNAAAATKNAATSRMAQMVSAIDTMIRVEGIPAEQALKRLQAQISNLTLQQNQDVASGRFGLDTADQNLRRTTAMNTDAREREIQEASRKTELQNIATTRGKSVAQDILPFSIPGAKDITLPMLGTMPLPQVNADQLYSQGLPDLVSQWNSPISQTPPNLWPEPTVAPPMTPLTLPELPAPAPDPDIDKILQRILGFL